MKKLLIVLAISTLLEIFGCTSNQIANKRDSNSIQHSIKKAKKPTIPTTTEEKYIRYTKNSYNNSVEKGKVI